MTMFIRPIIRGKIAAAQAWPFCGIRALSRKIFVSRIAEVACPKPVEQVGPGSAATRPTATCRQFVRLTCWRYMWLVAALLGVGIARAANPAGSITEKPLLPHPFPRGKTMFIQLPAEQTGVVTTNNFADPKMRGERYQEFETSSVGCGVAIGDYDGDGLPDIFVVSKTESCRLFRNLGNFKFEDVTEKAGVGDHGADAMIWKQSATFVDVNNDGLLDIYVCRTGAPNLLYINQGNGTFKEMAHAYGLDVNDSSVVAAFCDYDRDGWLDVYIATNILDIVKHPKGQRGYLFHNNRNGTFTNVTEQAGIVGETQSHSATWWDYDNDGWPDLYVAYDYGLPDSLYHNNRDGTFTNVIDRVGPKKAHKLLAQAKNRNASVCCRRVGPQSPRGAIVRGNERAAQRRPLSPYFLGVVIAPFR